MLLDDKRFLITGVLTPQSIAFSAAQAVQELGAEIVLTNFGRTVSPRAFGHAGAGGQIAWADPATGLSFCYLTNGLDANVLRQARRGLALSSRAAALCD